METYKCVSSDNEWDPLEEVIVGVVDGAGVPIWDSLIEAVVPRGQEEFFQRYGGTPWPSEEIAAAAKELENFVSVLTSEGITVKRPSRASFVQSFSTPQWSQPTGLYAAMPRDYLLIVGDIIIESPMAWRSRYFEGLAYRELLKDYFRRGARWLPAPRPELSDQLFTLASFNRAEEVNSGASPLEINEFEPVFDAADFIRLGNDIIAQRSHVTNAAGIEWVRRCIGPSYKIHEHVFNDSHPMHIDATIMPLAPGKALINPERVTHIPPPLNGWDLLPAPRSTLPKSHPMRMCSPWVVMNVLSLDERRVVVEAQEEPLILALKNWGFEPIPVPFRGFYSFGGSFHCATADIRRRKHR
jgi:glycine amidinotransferase